MSILKIPTAKVFEPLLRPARYKGAFGGRGSGKSHFFGELLVEMCQAERGTLAVCIREAQRTLAQSSKRLIESKIASLGVGQGFKNYSDRIATPGDGVMIFRGMRYFLREVRRVGQGSRSWDDAAARGRRKHLGWHDHGLLFWKAHVRECRTHHSTVTACTKLMSKRS
ncbi:phage terminase large subunit [Bradyrhizobium pachyrhizi]|uniref:phage terminase large subunit n=1 Tax=Bradyrhizobium pachyrhizi TaxID=280333 RepID=UPI003D9BA16D